MRFRVLGPIRTSPRTPTAAKVRVLLAALLIRANEAVPTESLIDELWDNDPPRTAATTLHVYVSQLRKILAEGCPQDSPQSRPLLTVPPGYRLRVAEDELDLARFEALQRDGRSAYDRGDFENASGRLHEGLALWTGRALSGIPHGPMLSTAAVRLEELRLNTLEQRIAADLQLGRHHELTGELMALVGEHPLRETLHAHLMVALYRSDRQSAALQAFGRVRRALVDELGIEPGPGLRSLHGRILRADPALSWHRPAAGTPAAPAPVVRLPPAVPDFVGREEALTAANRSLLDGAGEASPQVLAVTGRAGVGKTTLAVEVARRSAALFPHGRVFVTLRGPQGTALDADQAMTRLLHQLQPSPDAADAADPAAQLHRLVQGRRLLVVLDDAVSEEQVRPLLAAMPGVLTIVTSRRTLAGLEGTRHLALDVLRPEEAQQLLVAVGGPRMAEDMAACRDIARLCGFLPLALRVAGAGLATRPHWSAAALAERMADERESLGVLVAGDLDVRSGLLLGYHETPEAEQRAFRLLALAPVPDFPLWSVAALLDTTVADAERIAERLVESHLLEDRHAGGGHPHRYGYHRLLRALALELLESERSQPARTAATGRLCTAFLAYARHADALLTPGRVVYPVRDTAAVVPGVPDPAKIVGRTPVRWFQQEAAGLVGALRQAHAAGLWHLVWELAESLVGWFDASIAWSDWDETHRLALDAARRAEHPRARAVVLRSLGDLAWQQQRTQQAAEYYDTARALLAEIGDRSGQARCLIGTADVALSEGEPVLAGKVYAEALELCAAEGDERGRADALRGLAIADLQRGRTDAALDGFAAFTEAAELLGDRRWAQFGSRSLQRMAEQPPGSRDGRPGGRRAPQPVEARPGVWLVGPAGS